MAIEKVVNIVVNQKGADKATAQVNKLNASLKNVQATSGGVTSAMKSSGNAVLENGGAMGLLNDLTGGYAMTIKDAVEASALFTKGTTIATAAQKLQTLVIGGTTGALKALRVALITTGLGAVVVAIGYMISKMSEASNATEELTADQERLNKQLEDTKKFTDDVSASLDYYTGVSLSLAKRRGASDRELKKIEIDGINAKMKANIDEINLIKSTQDEEYKLTSEQNKRIQVLREENQKLLREGRLSVVDFETDLVIKQREKEKEDAEKAKQDRIKSEEEKQKAREEAEKKRKEFEEAVAQGQLDLQYKTVQAEFEQAQLKIEEAERVQKALQAIAEEQTKIENEEEEKRKLYYEITEKSKVDITNNTFDLLGQLAKKGGLLAKSIAIADVIRGQVASVSKIISSTAEANAKAVALSPLTAGQPFVTLNTISAGIGIGASVAGAIKAIKAINSDSQSVGGSSISGGGGASAPPAPSFNLVQGTGSNQIAQGLANQTQPIQAYVVSGAVTTSQQLDRNIVRDASL